MTISEDLLAADRVTQHPTEEDAVVINIPIKVKKIALDNKAVDDYAKGLFRWTPFITQPVLDADGKPTFDANGKVVTETVPNPMDALAAAIDFNQNRIGTEFKQIITNKAVSLATAQAMQQAQQIATQMGL